MPDYDLIIIGAGIHGAAVARAAAHDGFKTCVIEQYSKAGMATSSRSSKLIHGGLRYLESYQFKLVKECLTERAILLKTAPSLVKLTPFYIPVYTFNKRPAWMIFIGLMLYRMLGGGKFSKLPRDQWNTLDDLKTADLKAVYQYYDALTDDQKLTRAILSDAIDHGVNFISNTEVVHCELDTETSVTLANQQRLSARIIINSSGPWVNQLLLKTSPTPPIHNIELVQGTHIVIPRSLSKGIYYIEAEDKRVIFAIPWQQGCLLGTTETCYNGPADKVTPLKEEINYLLSTWNRYFADSLNESDVLQSFAGLRVLPADNASAFNRARDTILLTDNDLNPRIISIYGGKLTAHRATADSVMKLVHRQLPGHQRTNTARLHLPA